MSTLLAVELGVLGPLQVRRGGAPVTIPGAKPRAILTMLGLHGGSVVSTETLIELLWGDDPPRTAAKALQTHISSLRRTLGDGFVLTQGTGWILNEVETDASRYKRATKEGRDAAAAGDTSQAAVRFDEALALWRGTPELPDSRRGISEKTRWIEGHAALVEDRADALLATGRAAEIIGELEAAVAEAPLRERRWGQLMLALYRAGRQGEALGAYQRARSLLVEELGVDPGPELRRLEAAIVAQDTALDMPVAQHVPSVTRAVTFLLTDIEGSTAAWEADAGAMAEALARHDELVEQVVTSRGGRLIKTRGEGDATFSVFERPSAAAAAAIELQDAILHEPWGLQEPMRIRVALHTGEAELRDGDYFGRAVNRAARLRSLATGGQILCSGAIAELVIDSLPDDVVLADLGMRQLKNLARPEHVFELRLETAEPPQQTSAPVERPGLPAVLTGPGPFVGRGPELQRLVSAWQTVLTGGMHAVLIAGEPGVGKTRLAGEWSRQAYQQGAIVLYGRCDEDLGAPYQPFAEALRSLMPCLGASRLRGLRGVEALLALVPGLTDVLPDLTAPTRADPETERYALFDAVVALLELASASAPIVLILDDLHWAAKPTLLLLRHLLRFGEHARVQVVGTYRSTDLDRSHPLAATLADLHRDSTANRLTLSGLDEDDVTTYVAEAGYDDEDLARALASVTGGNPFFLIEALRHVDESGGVWDPSTLPQGVREAVSRRLSRLPAETNKALAAAAVVGSRFALDLVERVVEQDLVDAFDEACKAGIVIEEPGGRYRFNHAIVRQSLLAELASVRRMRLHQRIAATLETQPGADDELLAELAYHYFECAWAGNAAKAVEYCRRAADQAMARLAYEGAADLYDRALHALEELDEELPDRDEQVAELLVARCEALLAAGDVASAADAVSKLREATRDSARLSAWATCFDGQLSMLIHPERLDEVEAALGAAAEKLAGLDDAAGEATAHTVRAGCLARLGRIADCELALDDALTAARRAREHRRVNAVLAGAPLAALWGPNPVPRAGGRCLDVVRLLRITTDSPAVEATSTRCQAVLEAFRGRAAAARRMIDSARRTVTELGLRHALLEVEQFAGIVELVVDDPAAAEEHLRKAYNGFRRMGLDADTAETAAFLGRACLALGRDAEADELCSESERLAGHALKASIAWRTLRARLLSRRGEQGEARRVAEAAVSLAERTDALVDHGDACLTLAVVLGAAGDDAAARAAAERAADLYERKGAAALTEKARQILGEPETQPPSPPPGPPTVELDNACVRVGERAVAALDRDAWDEYEQLYAPEASIESHRKIVGFQQIDVPPGEWRHLARRVAETQGLRATQMVVAVRGECLALARVVLSTADKSPGAPHDELLQLYGIDEEGRIALQVFYDVEDMDAAMAELDTLHARFEELRRQSPAQVELDNACVRAIRRFDAAIAREAWAELAQELASVISVDSRRKIVGFPRRLFDASELAAAVKRYYEEGMRLQRRVVAAIRGERLALTRLEMGTKGESPGAPQDELLQVIGLDEDHRIALHVWFDVDDIDSAMAELDALHTRFEAERSRMPLENAASQLYERFKACYAARDWQTITEMLADNVSTEDRRRVVNAGLRQGPDAVIAELSGLIDVVKSTTSESIATRGARLLLSRSRTEGYEAFRTDFLDVLEVDTDGRAVARIVFDVDDFDAAIAELDARYLAGEAAPYAQTWSVIAAGYASLNRRELSTTTTNFESIDHRRAAAFAPGDLMEYLITGDLDQDVKPYIEAVHRLSDLGAVVTHTAYGTSREGFDAEWQEVHLCTVDGDAFNRSELFDEADLDAAIARFDQLSRPAPPLENAASRVAERFTAHYAAGDWQAMAEVLADNYSSDDRRRVVGSGVRYGRDAHLADMRARAELWLTNRTSTVVATRGERLALMRIRLSSRDQGQEAFVTEVLIVDEIDADERLVAGVAFDLDDFDAALGELDARYVAGEAASYAHTWSVTAAAYAGFNRRNLIATTPDWVNIDHRRGAAFAPGDFIAYLQAAWDDSPDTKIYIETVHRLNDFGAVVTHVGHGISQGGFDAEWRDVFLITAEGDLVSRCELFDESDLDAALARLEQLSRPAPRLENAASRLYERFKMCFAARDWRAITEMLADNILSEDRRHVVNSGLRQGRDALIAELSGLAELGTEVTTEAIAIRGANLVLSRGRASQGPDGFEASILDILELDADGRFVTRIVFDVDDFDAAIAELDARYLAGEAAPHAHTWSLITGTYATLNRHELPAVTQDWVDIDHRPVVAIESGALGASLRAMWNLAPEATIYVETVHRLNDLGAVIAHVAYATSREGFEGEWRDVVLLTFEGDKISRGEVFDEAELDAALARFDELSPKARRLENAASQAYDRFNAYFARDWDAMAKLMADDFSIVDRRHVVGEEGPRDRDGHMANMRAGAALGFTNLTSTVIATRGRRLILARACCSTRDQGPGLALVEVLCVVEINDVNQIAAIVVFDPDDIDTALAELDARYLAGEAAAYAHTWSLIVGTSTAFNRHEMFPTTPDWVNIDHRSAAAFAPGEMFAYTRAILDDAPDSRVYIEAVHRLNNFGGVVTEAAHGTSQQGFEAEWRLVGLCTVDHGLINRAEMFDEADLDVAIAKFDQLSGRAPRLENTASRVSDRFLAYFAERNWDAMAEMTADDFSSDDRRRVVGAGVQLGRDVDIENMRAWSDVGIKNMTSDVIAIRGERVFLGRTRFWGPEQRPDAFHSEVLGLIEIDADERIVARVVFDRDDFDAAFEELDARYLAGEATPYSQTWSVISRAYAGFNRGELPATSPGWPVIDHRHAAAMGPSEGPAYFRASWELAAELNVYIEAVHRLSDLGAVFTHVGKGTSQDGFEAEWRTVDIMTVEGENIDRGELFDEADLDTAIAEFDQLNRRTPRLENAASQMAERFLELFTARDWDTLAEILADDYCNDDRRPLVGKRIRHGRNAAIANIRTIADLGFTKAAATVIALRGRRLSLVRFIFSGRDQGLDLAVVDVVCVVEINDVNQIAAIVVFELDDFDAAIAELDARYLAGDAAANSQTWTAITATFAALNRHEYPATTAGFVNIDHRRGTAFAPGELFAYLDAAWKLTPDRRHYIEAVHRLDHLGAVCDAAAYGTSEEGFDAEWRMIPVLTVEGDLIDRCEIFEETDLDPALARFEELHSQARPLKNALVERFLAHFTARDWDAMAQDFAEEYYCDDRRRVVNAGLRQGRDAAIEDLRTANDVGALTNITLDIIATRGERLILTRWQASGPDREAVQADALQVLEHDADDRFAACVVFDLDDIDAAFAELDSRYVAGEAAAHAHTWSVIAKAYDGFNRRDLIATTPDWVNIDHRRGAAFAPGDIIAYLQAAWNDSPDTKIYIEAVHRLDNLGAVVTHVAHGISHEGFDAEWRDVFLITVEGNLVSRCELFDESDLDTALMKFEHLARPAPRLENAASRADERVLAYFAAHDWDSMTQILADDYYSDDRRRVVNVGHRQSRDTVIERMKTTGELAITFVTCNPIAIRGERLVLSRARWSGPDHGSDAFHTEALSIVQLDADERIAARVWLDANDIDAAFEELDARYLAGEAAAHTHTWSVITRAYAAANRNELPATTPDWVNVDHRRLRAFGPGELETYMRATWDVIPDTKIYIESVHRLSNLGAVVTHAVSGTSREGFDAEWREVSLSMVDGDRFNRTELFDEADLDAALARFDELSTRSAPHLENAASRRYALFMAYFAARDWDAMAEVLADDMTQDDRRRVVNGGIRRGRDVEIADMQALAEVGVTDMTSEVMAIRRERLALCRAGSAAFQTEVLNVVEIDADGRIAAVVGLDLDDLDAAFEELDARYLAGEAAAHAHMWSMTTQAYAAINRHEIPPTTSDLVTVDHRRAAAFAPGDMVEYLRAGWDIGHDITFYIEAVHRLGNLGVVVTHVGKGSSREGFDAEWREINLMTAEGGAFNRCEIYEEADLDAALARVDELNAQPPLENAASRVYERYRTHFAARNWAAMAELLTADTSVIDHRRLVNSGVRRGREVEIANMQAVAGIGTEKITSTVIATRGERLALCRTCIHGPDQQPGAFRIEFLSVVEIDSEERIMARNAFDLDDIDAAFKELDERYLAGEAKAYSLTWSVIMRAYAALNRREMPSTTPDWVNIDHRHGMSFAPGDLPALLASWNLAPNVSSSIEAVHRLTNRGAVITSVSHETSHEGVDAEWRVICVLTVEGDLIDRLEVFDENEIDAALARFDELQTRTPRLENAAGRILERYQACFSACDWAALAELLAEDIVAEDRRRVVNAGVRRGRDVHIADLRTAVEVGAETISLSLIATRGEQLALAHARAFNRGFPRGEVGAEWLGVVEIDAEERIVAMVIFNLDDINTAFRELETRYIAGEAAAYADTWTRVTRAYAALNRRELPATARDWVNIDHRILAPIPTGDLSAYLRATWDLSPQSGIYIETVHRLSEFGALVTHVVHGTSQQGFEAEWRTIDLSMYEGDRINRCELFDETDLDAALTRFQELQAQARCLGNAASQVNERFWAYFGARDWAAMADLVAANIYSDDRRRVVNGGVRHGRDAHIADMQAIAEIVDPKNLTPTVIATRGARLALCHIRSSNSAVGPEEITAEVLSVVEIDAENRIAANIGFDIDDLDSAFNELDSRYGAGEAAAHSHTWSVITRSYSASNRREVAGMTPDSVFVDHRPGVTTESEDLAGYLPAIWGLMPDLSSHIEAVHRLSELGGVITHAARGTSQEGFDAEWRTVNVFTIEGDLINRVEVYDEADLDAALARFDELDRPTPPLENAATRARVRTADAVNRRDVDGVLAFNAVDARYDDRRKGLRDEGAVRRDVVRAIFEAPREWLLEVSPIAIRGSRLALTRDKYRDTGDIDRPITAEHLMLTQVGADGLLRNSVIFDPDDIDAAFEELDARFLAGEAAAHAQTWSVIARECAAFNRHELAARDYITVDHRPLPIVEAYTQAALRVWDVTPDFSIHIEAVHRLSGFGAVATYQASGTSREGFDGEWRMILLVSVEGDLINRVDVYDESDLEAALARFDELHSTLRPLENAASRADDRFFAHMRARDWTAAVELLADNSFVDDRRRVVNIGVWDGREVVMTNIRALADALADVTSTAIATRGERLALTRICAPNRDIEHGDFGVEMLGVVETGTDERIAAHVMFDPDDMDAAFEELDARYLAGEAAPHAQTWLVVARECAAFNRHELPAADWSTVDHRRLAVIDATEGQAAMRAIWEVTPNLNMRIQAVHRLGSFGVVATYSASGTSPEGLDVEWPMILLLVVEGDRINRCEVFDETDLGAALARFDELDQPLKQS